MSDKCEWKGIKAEGSPTKWTFNPCDNFEPTEQAGAIYCDYCDKIIERPSSPTEPTHEEVAKEYINKTFVDPLKNNTIFDSLNKAFDDISGVIEDTIKKAFIAGRKSADIPPEG